MVLWFVWYDDGSMSFVPAPGKVLEGRYMLREHLGDGGMGSVWRSEHVKLGTPVAVKLLAPAMVASVEARERFRREAKVAASLESQNIVRVVDFGVEGDTPFIAMELLQGETLGLRLARGPLSAGDTARIVAQVARGIGKAHQLKVVHCDIKPENVFLARLDGEEIAKVLDFGIAKAPLFDPVTKTGAVLGTLQYMSPEQLEGRRGIGVPSDLYSLAIVVFECVCGRPAFKADSIAELVRRICGAPLPVPSELATVPSGFDAWFLRAAHRNPVSRYATAHEMSDALGTVLNAAPTMRAARTRTAKLETAPTVHAQRGSINGGTESAGFRLAPMPERRLLEIELWGLWDTRLAEESKAAFGDAFKAMSGAPWVALAFGTRHPPQRPEVQAIEGETMGSAASFGMQRTAFVIDSALAKLMAKRLAVEHQMPNTRFFTDEAEARAWLGELQPRSGR